MDGPDFLQPHPEGSRAFRLIQLDEFRPNETGQRVERVHLSSCDAVLIPHQVIELPALPRAGQRHVRQRPLREKLRSSPNVLVPLVCRRGNLFSAERVVSEQRFGQQHQRPRGRHRSRQLRTEHGRATQSEQIAGGEQDRHIVVRRVVPSVPRHTDRFRHWQEPAEGPLPRLRQELALLVLVASGDRVSKRIEPVQCGNQRSDFPRLEHRDAEHRRNHPIRPRDKRQHRLSRHADRGGCDVVVHKRFGCELARVGDRLPVVDGLHVRGESEDVVFRLVRLVHDVARRLQPFPHGQELHEPSVLAELGRRLPLFGAEHVVDQLAQLVPPYLTSVERTDVRPGPVEFLDNGLRAGLRRLVAEQVVPIHADGPQQRRCGDVVVIQQREVCRDVVEVRDGRPRRFGFLPVRQHLVPLGEQRLVQDASVDVRPDSARNPLPRKRTIPVPAGVVLRTRHFNPIARLDLPPHVLFEQLGIKAGIEHHLVLRVVLLALNLRVTKVAQVVEQVRVRDILHEMVCRNLQQKPRVLDRAGSRHLLIRVGTMERQRLVLRQALLYRPDRFTRHVLDILPLVDFGQRGARRNEERLYRTVRANVQDLDIPTVVGLCNVGLRHGLRNAGILQRQPRNARVRLEPRLAGEVFQFAQIPTLEQHVPVSFRLIAVDDPRSNGLFHEVVHHLLRGANGLELLRGELVLDRLERSGAVQHARNGRVLIRGQVPEGFDEVVERTDLRNILIVDKVCGVTILGGLPVLVHDSMQRIAVPHALARSVLAQRLGSLPRGLQPFGNADAG